MTQNKQLVITEDFNSPKTNWNTMNGDLEDNRLFEMLDDTLMIQIITKPTRANILDFVLVSDLHLVREGRVGEKLNGCEHHLIRFSIRTDQELLENPSKILDYIKVKFNLARELLPQATWEDLHLTLADDAWSSFKNVHLEVGRTMVPVKARRTNRDVNSPWITFQVRSTITQ